MTTTETAIDTHAAVKQMMAAKLTEAQAEAIVGVLASSSERLATKRDIIDLEARIDQRLSGLEDKFEGRISGLEDKLEGRR